MKASRAWDLIRKGWLQGVYLLQYPRDLPKILKWIIFDHVHPGELLALYPYRHLIRHVSPKTVIDVGANTGQFSSAIGILIPEARIYAFEPIAECQERYRKRLKGRPETTLFGVAVGDKVEEKVLRVSEFSESSSLMDMTELHKLAFPWTARHSEAKVGVTTLDASIDDVSLNSPILLKVDVQGYELEVLHGARKVLAMTSLLIVETAFQPLYAGQHLFEDVHDYLTSLGFTYLGGIQQILDPKTGRPLQADSLYVRQ